jgi:WD40 repeat protein
MDVRPQASDIEPTLIQPGVQKGEATPSPQSTPGSSPTMTPRHDRTLPRRFGDYELLSEIARGGMGVVYVARQLKAGNRKVALKMILGGENASGQTFDRFHREARLVAGINHPGIVPVHEVGEVDGQPFYSMTLIEGGSLQQRLQTEGPMEPHPAARLVKQVAEAVQYAHDHDIIHRDIKPHNILLRGTREQGTGTRGSSSGATASTLVPAPSSLVPLITDFGLARTQVGGASVTGELLGTPSYMSPEQAAGKVHEIGPISDVYSLGAVLYCVLTGRPPFQSASPMETMRQVLEQDPVPPRHLNPALPRDLETICLKCLQKEPARRYASAQDMAGDLDRFLKDEPIVARPQGMMERVMKWVRRRPAAAALVGVSLLTVLLVLAGGVYFLQQQRVVAERDEAIRARQSADDYRQEAERLSALLLLKNGTNLCEDGDAGRGMLWMARSLSTCPPSAHALERSIRTALPEAASSLHTLEAMYNYPSPTTAVAFSPDGKTLLFGGKNPILLDTGTGLPRPGREISDRNVSAAAFSADGKRLAIGTMAGIVRIADPTTGVNLATPITQKGTLKTVAFRPDGKVLLVAGQFGVSLRVYDANSLQMVQPEFACKDNLFGAAYSPDGKLVATAAKENNASLWDASTGRLVGKPLPHPGVVFAVAFSPDGKTLATGCLDSGIRLWDIETGRTIGPVMHHKAPVRSVVFSNDGRLVLSSSEDGTARVWESASGRPVGQVMSHPSELRQAIFTPDQKHILTAGFEGTARLWKLASEQSLARILKHPGAVADVAFSTDGKMALTGCQESDRQPGESRLWNPITGAPLGPAMPQQGQVMSVRFSPDGKYALTAGNDGTARLWKTADASAAFPPWRYGNIVAATAFSPDGKLIALGGRGGTIQLRDTASGDIVKTWQAYDREMWVWSMSFTSDGKQLLTGGGSDAKMWSVPDGKPIGGPMHHDTEVRVVMLSPDGEVILTCSYDKTARLWSAHDQKPLSPKLVHKGEVRNGTISPDGKVAATAAADGTVRLWEIPTGRSLMSPLFHDGWVRAVAFSPDGKTLATGCDDGSARLWNAADGAPLGAVLQHHGPVTGIVFSPDGKTLLSASNDGTARLWSPSTPLRGDPASVALWVQVLTGMELDAEGTVQVLSSASWEKRRKQLQEIGEPADANP